MQNLFSSRSTWQESSNKVLAFHIGINSRFLCNLKSFFSSQEDSGLDIIEYKSMKDKLSDLSANNRGTFNKFKGEERYVIEKYAVIHWTIATLRNLKRRIHTTDLLKIQFEPYVKNNAKLSIVIPKTEDNYFVGKRKTINALSTKTWRDFYLIYVQKEMW